MIKKIGLLLFAGLVLTACEQKLHDLTMSRMPYVGNELRTDGYYYSTIPEYSDPTIGVIVLYRNGVCMEMLLSGVSGADNKNIEKKLLNKDLMARFFNRPDGIGVFRINNNRFEMETWRKIWDTITFSYWGEILNNTTLLIKEMRDNDSGKTFVEKRYYHFKPFAHKPDSTNNFIK